MGVHCTLGFTGTLGFSLTRNPKHVSPKANVREGA
jgi:hypothetical protein